MLIHHEAVSQHVLERGRTRRSDRGQNGRLKPAAVLVRAFQIHERREPQPEFLAEHDAMARA